MDHAAIIVALAYRFRLIIEGACEVVRAHCREDWVIGPRFGLINNGMMRRLRRFERLVELLLAGIADPVRPSRRAPAEGPGDPPGPAATRTRCERWPGRRAWLLDKLGWRVALYGARMNIWLSDPETQALLRSSRKMRRVLRPIWRALTSDTLPDCLREPERDADSTAPDAAAGAPTAVAGPVPDRSSDTPADIEAMPEQPRDVATGDARVEAAPSPPRANASPALLRAVMDDCESEQSDVQARPKSACARESLEVGPPAFSFAGI